MSNTVNQTEAVIANQKQEQILQGAMRVFLSTGYSGTSMDKVSAEARVSKQTIYSHFGDKQGLFKALMEWVTVANFHSVFCGEEFKDEPAVFLRRLGETFFTKVADNPDYLGLFRVMVSESERFPELAKLYTQTVIQQGRSLMSEYFLSHPELKLNDPDAVAQIFFGSLVSHIVVQEMLYGKELMPLSRARLLDSLIKLVLCNSCNGCN
ncbi:TetR family transcriptional regulator [Calothrix sp. HK-06]|nr:TetR family transcriptional regulator [Calothrix sp. HK-06]